MEYSIEQSMMESQGKTLFSRIGGSARVATIPDFRKFRFKANSILRQVDSAPTKLPHRRLPQLSFRDPRDAKQITSRIVAIGILSDLIAAPEGVSRRLLR